MNLVPRWNIFKLKKIENKLDSNGHDTIYPTNYQDIDKIKLLEVPCLHPSIDDNNMEIITYRTKMLLIAQDDIPRDIISEIKRWLALAYWSLDFFNFINIRIPSI
jgi:hypothetical protein